MWGHDRRWTRQMQMTRAIVRATRRAATPTVTTRGCQASPCLRGAAPRRARCLCRVMARRRPRRHGAARHGECGARGGNAIVQPVGLVQPVALVAAVHARAPIPPAATTEVAMYHLLRIFLFLFFFSLSVSFLYIGLGLYLYFIYVIHSLFLYLIFLLICWNESIYSFISRRTKKKKKKRRKKERVKKERGTLLKDGDALGIERGVEALHRVGAFMICCPLAYTGGDGQLRVVRREWVREKVHVHQRIAGRDARLTWILDKLCA